MQSLPQPQPLIFEDREKLVAALSKHKTDWWNLYEPIRASIQRKFGKLNVEAIVEASVASNTFRAFHNCSSQPSQVFRKWAKQEFARTLDEYRGAKNQRKFDKWLGDVVQSLQKAWPEGTRQKLGFGPSLKLVNLVAKDLCICEGINSEDGKSVARYLHVPLDRYTIVALRNCTSDVPPAIWRIPNTATMSFIQKPELYWAFQYRIRELAFAADVPPIVFDFVCWNERRSPQPSVGPRRELSNELSFSGRGATGPSIEFPMEQEHEAPISRAVLRRAPARRVAGSR